MIKIGIDPSGTGTTAIVIYEDNKLIKKLDFTNKDWKYHDNYIIEIIGSIYYFEVFNKIK
ncbi:hypothetical protein SDAV_00190 [Spiroplasma phoeniceum P40]|uniref:Uncharacterized protein n=1 Tax=Spiroplasma phoeniceum P40 TaxID=1276259 RepID=A0A345DLU7_9MOLU|nr:hypothetical protein SDAV_00190 [Spiroplasma phoeniceum P40]